METLLSMADSVEAAVDASIHAFQSCDEQSVKFVMAGEPAINKFEVTIDNEVVKFFALQHPVAIDLRLMLSIQIVNNDLERIGDHAVNIAESATRCPASDPLALLPELVRMAETVKIILNDSLESFFKKDSKLARELLLKDDEIDRMNKDIILRSIELAKTNPGLIEPAIEYIRVSKNLERIADLSTNIAEEEIFHDSARVAKHHTDASVEPFSV
jgi:phosphate transport system protein